MAELRWNPLIKDWVMIASHRQNRPQMPKDWCPFCPGSGKVPDHFDVYEYDNDFPALRPLFPRSGPSCSLKPIKTKDSDTSHIHKIRLYRMMLKQEFTRQSQHTASAKLFCTHRSIL